MRYQLVEILMRMLRDTAEHVGRPVLRIDVVALSRADERIYGCASTCPVVRAGKEVVLPAQSDWSDGVLDEVVVDLNLTVSSLAHERRSALERAGDGLAPRTLG